LRYPVILDKCQDMAVIFSSSQLGELFEHAGTAFLDFAERSEDYSVQGLFFEAMGLIQRRRTDVEQVFRREISQGFKELGRLDFPLPATDSANETEEASVLSLVGQEEMEEHLVIQNIIVKANESFFPDLFTLRQRFAELSGGKKLKNQEIPAGPHHLVHAFRRSLDGFEIQAKIRVILFALFEKFVVKQAKGLYEELNGTLKDAGIRPNLKTVKVRSKTSKSDAQQEQENSQANKDGKGPTSLGEELFDSIIDLMAKRPGAGRRALPPRTEAERAAAAARSRELVAVVDDAQSRTTPEGVHTAVAEAVAIPNLEIDLAFIEKVKDILSHERAQVLSQIDRDKLPPMDADLIDLIGMLFEFMLNDPILPNLAKALLSHLHTPYLKVALIDRRLLADPHHPARRLLDQMVEAGTLWVDESNARHGIFPALQGIVDRVLKEFSDDVALFEELLASFEQSMKEQQRKTDTIEQRTQDTALGREKLRLAKQRADEQIQSLLGRTPLPTPVTGFLSKTWLDRLVFIQLRNETDHRGEVWQQAIKTAGELVSLFEPKAETAPLDADRIAELRNRLIEGVRNMGSYPRIALDALLKFLDAPKTWQKACAEAVAAKPKASPAEKTAKESVAQEDNLASRAAISEQEKEIIDQLIKMKFGTWFEFKSATGGVPRRIKLSWLSRLTATCLFVDRSGMQAEIKTLQELAKEILSGHAKVIPRPMHPFIERALVSIRGMLQGGE